MNTKLNLPTIKELRQQGWKIRVSHYRYPTKHSDLTPIKEMKDDEGKYIFPPEPLGGKVEIEARDPSGNEFRGESVCSKVEPFCKARGRNLALARAIANPKPPRFKPEDEVYVVSAWAIKKVKVKTAESKLVIDSDGDVVTQENYELEGYYGKSLMPLFATKEELVNSIE